MGVDVDVTLLSPPGEGSVLGALGAQGCPEALGSSVPCIVLCVLLFVYLFRAWGGFFLFKYYFSPLCCG